MDDTWITSTTVTDWNIISVDKTKKIDSFNFFTINMYKMLSQKRYPIFVQGPILTDGPTMVLDPTWTSAPKIALSWTTAPNSTRAVESITAELWYVPPPFCHLRNSFSTLPPLVISNLDNHRNSRSIINNTLHRTQTNFTIYNAIIHTLNKCKNLHNNTIYFLQHLFFSLYITNFLQSSITT